MSENNSTPSLRLLALAPFAGDALAKPRRIEIDKDRFDEALASVAPHIALAVPNRLGAGEDPLHVSLSFARLADFAPGAIVERVPVLARLREARDAIDALERGEIDLAGLRTRTAGALPAAWLDALEASNAGSTATASPEPPEATGNVDSILDLVETSPASGDVRDTARRLVGGLAAGRARSAAAPRTATAALRAQLDESLGAQLDALLAAPSFCALESTWRGLKLLVDRTDFREPIALELVSAPVDEAAAVVAALEEGDDVDLVLADYAFDASARDLERLEHIAAAAAAAQTPVATAIAPAFFGLDSWRGLARLRDPNTLLGEPAYADWRSLRERDDARWIVLMANRVALRAAYGPQGESTRGLPYQQHAKEGLLGSPVWALGAVLSRTFARTRACLQFTGAQNGLLSDLPLLPLGPDDKPTPVEGVFSNERREDLERAGLAVLQLYQRDTAFLGAARSFRKPPRYPDAEATADAAQQTTLAYQLYASRFVKFLGRVVPLLSGLEGPEAVKSELRSQVLKLLSTPEKPLRADHVGVEVRDHPDDASLYVVSLRALPEITIAGRPANMLMSFAVRR